MATFTSDYTPLQYNVAGNYKYRQTLLTKKQLQVQLSAGMRRRWVGPVPPDVFMTEFMPISEDHLKEYEEKREEVRFRLLPPKGKRNTSQQERRLYRAFAACIVRHDLSPNMPFFISADKKNKNTDCRPDAGLKNRIIQKELHPVPATNPYATRSKAAAAANAPKEPRVLEPQPFNWNLDTLVVEFKGSSVNDPFYTEASIKKQMADTKRDYDVSFEKATSPARKVRGQLAMYAREIFNHQQRTHLFQLLITGRRARLIYFDHSGAIVSESIDYITNPGVLGEFFWRYNYMTDEARGIDTTTKKATDSDEALFTSAITELLANMDDPSRPERKIPSAEVTLDKDYPVYSMTVHEGVEHAVGEKSGAVAGNNAGDDEGPTTMELLVQRPIFDAVSPLGRGTRGYIAVAKTPNLSKAGLNGNEDKNTKKQTTSLFLKDTWRVDHALLKAESEVYRLLESYGVARIPRLICGGDVRDSSGKVQRTICAEWAQRVRKTFEVDFADFRAHLHHRLVQRLAYPIEAASRSEEMVKAFDNVLEVIDQAYTKIPSKVLHRDLSAGNVMLGDKEENEVGLLGDWDHAIENEPKEGYDHQRYRTGTWPFISISLLNDPTKEHEILDDLESLFWTFLYSATHRFKHSGVLDMNIFNWWRDEYDKDGLPTGRILGGERKLAALPDIASGESILFDCQPLQTLIASLATSLYDYYHAINKVKIAGYALSNSPNNLIAKEEYQEACDTRDRLHTRLSKPAYWRARFQIALQSDASSWIDDVSDKPLHPPRTEDKQMQLQELRTRTSMQSGARPAKRPVVLPDAVDSDSEVEGEEAEVAEDSSCDEGDDSEAFDDDDLDKIFAPISQLHGGQESTKLGPSPPLSPSMAARSRIPRSTGSFPGHFEDDVLRRSASPTPSSKRTHEDSDVGARLPKRYRSAPGPEGMPPPVLPAVTRRAAGRAGRSRQPLSGEGSSSVVEPARVRYSLRSQSKSKGQDRVKKN